VIAHSLRIIAITALVVACTFLPSLPGRYDSLAMTLSLLGQAFGLTGLLLVPAGFTWMAMNRPTRSSRARFLGAVIALVVAAVVWTLVALLALTDSAALTAIMLALGAFAFVKLLRSLLRMRYEMPVNASAISTYLVTVPLLVVLLQFSLDDAAETFSRNRAIRNSGPLIADIEAYRVTNGRYPPSMVSLHVDYHPSVMGIREYRYEPFGDAYNLLFEQRNYRLGIREIVMYNPKDQQAIASHALDVIGLTPAGLALDRTRGHNAVYDAAHPHWKYFWFD
jgi:hypothetical protein